MIEICIKNNNEVLNNQNLLTKQIKKQQVQAHFHSTNYDVINAYWTYVVFVEI